MSSRGLNSKSNGPVLLFKTIFRHYNCFPSSVAPDGKDGHGLKLEKIIRFNARLSKVSKSLFPFVLLDEISLISSSSYLKKEHFASG